MKGGDKVKSAIVEKARAKKKAREEVHQRVVEDNARLRNELQKANIVLLEAERQVKGYEKLKKDHERLVEWAVEAENKIDELKAALLELSE
jgi:hypothetical protein